MNDLALSEETTIAPVEVFLDGQSITEVDLESTCNDIIQRLNETSDTSEIEQAVTNLNGVEKFAARAKSKLIFAWSNWYKQVNKLDDFPKWFVQKFGGEELTVQKHQAIGELLSSDEVPDSVKQLNTKELVSVARAKQSGYDLTDSWDEIAHAGSESEISDIIHKVKGTTKRAGSLTIVVDVDGSITGHLGGEWANIGWLNFPDRDSIENEVKKRILTQGIARIINNSGIKDRK